jgi:hypothetical protein
MKYILALILGLIAAAVGLEYGGYKVDGVWLLIVFAVVWFLFQAADKGMK